MKTQLTDKKTWTVRGFPARLRQQFIGFAKMKGMTVAEALEVAVAAFVRQRREEESTR